MQTRVLEVEMDQILLHSLLLQLVAEVLVVKAVLVLVILAVAVAVELEVILVEQVQQGKVLLEVPT